MLLTVLPSPLTVLPGPHPAQRRRGGPVHDTSSILEYVGGRPGGSGA